MAIQNAVDLIKAACTQWNLGYDESNRLDFRKGGDPAMIKPGMKLIIP